MQKDEAFRLLLGSGFAVRAVEPKPNYHLFTVERTEILGTRLRYRVAVASGKFADADVQWLTREAGQLGGNLVLVGEYSGSVPDVPVLSPDQLADRLGGQVLSLMPLDPEYPARLVELGWNRLPVGLQGDADTLLETYVYAGLQLLLGARVVPYGQSRAFERVADGVVVGDVAPLVLYDAKAYGDGYEVNAASIRQFSSYVMDFHAKYERTLGRLAALLVISGGFRNNVRSRENRSQDLRAATGGVGLCFVSAETLAGAIRLLVEKPLYRKAVDWRRIFTNTTLELHHVDDALASAVRDDVLRV